MSKGNDFNFGSYLKEKRKAKKLTLLELSQQANVSKSYISMLENGKTPFPSVKILNKLAPPLGIQTEELKTLISHIRESEIFPVDESSQTETQSNLFVFDVEGLDESDIEKIKEQIELYKLRKRLQKGNLD